MSDTFNRLDNNDPGVHRDFASDHQGDGTLGEVSGTGAGVISGGVVGAAVAGPVGAVVGAVLGGVLGAAAGGAAHDIGEDTADDHGPQAADASRFHAANEEIVSPVSTDFRPGEPFARLDLDDDLVTEGELPRQAHGFEVESSGPSEAERVMLPPGA